MRYKKFKYTHNVIIIYKICNFTIFRYVFNRGDLCKVEEVSINTEFPSYFYEDISKL